MKVEFADGISNLAGLLLANMQSSAMAKVLAVGIPSVLHPDLVSRGYLMGFHLQNLQTQTQSKWRNPKDVIVRFSIPELPLPCLVTLYDHSPSTIHVPGQCWRSPQAIESFLDSDPGEDHWVSYLGGRSPTISLDTRTTLTMDHDTWWMGQSPDQCWRHIWLYSSQPDTCARRPLETGNPPIWSYGVSGCQILIGQLRMKMRTP